MDRKALLRVRRIDAIVMTQRLEIAALERQFLLFIDREMSTAVMPAIPRGK